MSTGPRPLRAIAKRRNLRPAGVSAGLMSPEEQFTGRDGMERASVVPPPDRGGPHRIAHFVARPANVELSQCAAEPVSVILNLAHSQKGPGASATPRRFDDDLRCRAPLCTLEEGAQTARPPQPSP